MGIYPRTANLRTARLGALVAAAALLSGCTQVGPTPSPTPSAAAPTAGAAPTAEELVWAGTVCSSTETLKKDVQGLITAATSGGDDVGNKLSAQMERVSAAAAALTATIGAVPAGNENDPERAAVTQAADEFSASIKDLGGSVNAVDGATGEALVTALQVVAGAAGQSVVALRATAQAIATAAADGSSTLAQAFDTAPGCAALTM